MFGSSILEVGISLVFVYFLLSLICTAFNEWVARIFAVRSSTLEEGIKNLINDPNLTKDAEKLFKEAEDLFKEAKELLKSGNKTDADTKTAEAKVKTAEAEQKLTHLKLYRHPIISGLYKQGKVDQILGRDGKPSYIPSQQFAIALIDTILEDSQGNRKAIKDFDEAVATLPDGDLKKALKTLAERADNQLDKFQKGIEEWFDASMERVSGWYARHMAVITLIFAVLISVLANADTVMMAQQFSEDSALRAAVVEGAGEWVTKSDAAPEATIEEIQETATELHLPLGWDLEPLPSTFGDWVLKVIGLLITTLALSLGAPFWFDVLNKLVNMRRTGKAPEEEEEEQKPQISFSYQP